MKKVWTKEQEDELRELYVTMSGEALAAHFGVTKCAIYQKCSKLGLKKEPPNKIHLTPQQELWLKLNFPHISTEICALFLGISHRAVIRLARRLRLVKTARFMKECQLYASKKAYESHVKNGTFPKKGYYSPNLQKGKKFQFKSASVSPTT